MRETFELSVFDGILLIHNADGDELLVDTGSPLSLAARPVNFLGSVRNWPESSTGTSMSGLTAQVGRNFDALLGTDVLSSYAVTINLKDKQMTFSDEEAPDAVPAGFSQADMTQLMGVPLVNIAVGGGEHRFALDTGARISYAHSSLVMGCDPMGQREDYHPALGRFTTPIYDLTLSVAKQPFRGQLGVLPKHFEMALGLAGIEGIMGHDLFKEFLTLIDFPASRLLVKRF